MVRNIKLLIAYDGTAYHGWQSQLNKPTIQETIEKALYTVMKQKINLTGSGRTDAGVHALGQVANFKADTRIPEDKIKIALNANPVSYTHLDVYKRQMEGTPKEIYSEADELERIGLGIPQTASIVRELRKRGFNIKQDVLTIEEAKEEILKEVRRRNV